VRFDADNIPHPDYLTKMNDAFDSGVKAAKGYNHSLNFTQNTSSGISALWYMRDNAFTCRARSFLHLSQLLVGGGMMFSAELVKDGFGCYSNSEDAQFTLKLARQKVKAEYVPEAIVYEDQPSSVADLFKRNMRMGGGLFKLFFTDGFKSLAYFFKTGNFSLVDLFLSIIFVPVALVGVIWFPCYYVFSIVYALVTANYALAYTIGKTIVYILCFAFIIPFILQAMLAYAVERKRVGVPFKKLVVKMIIFPLYMIIYAIGITLGALGFNSWHIAKRNAYYDQSFIDAYEKACGQKPVLRK
jgi:cellulose synthase/poly-beta-1,6-N-acetylglucosamine synthase-like glycosyltransferase